MNVCGRCQNAITSLQFYRCMDCGSYFCLTCAKELEDLKKCELIK